MQFGSTDEIITNYALAVQHCVSCKIVSLEVFIVHHMRCSAYRYQQILTLCDWVERGPNLGRQSDQLQIITLHDTLRPVVHSRTADTLRSIDMANWNYYVFQMRTVPSTEDVAMQLSFGW